MKQKFTSFERGLKDKMEDFEFSYDQESFTPLQRQMGMSKSGGSVWIISLISTILALSGGAVALYRNQHSPSVSLKASTTEHLPQSIKSITRGVSHSNTNASNLIGDSSSQLILSNQNTVGFQSRTSQETLSDFNTVENGIVPIEASQVSSGGNSSATSSVVATKKSDNIIAFNCNVRRACQGEEVVFQTTSGPKTGSYLWNFGDGHFSDEVNPTHKFAKAGNYDVSLSITSDNGQINTTVANDMISIEAAPDADFTWEFINSNPNVPEVRIVNLSTGGNSYEWNNGTQSNVDAVGTVFKLNTSGRQMVALSAKNDAGCTDGAVKHISVNTDFTLEAPQAWVFSKGTFMPAGLKKNKVGFTMTLLDASDNQVFQTSSRLKGWDGKLPSGRMATAGEAYSYIIIVTNDLTQEQKYFNGIFTVFP